MLKKLASRFSGNNMMQTMGAQMIPMVLPMATEHLEQLNQMEEDGGLRREGEEHIGYLVLLIDGKPALVTAAISANEQGRPELIRNIATIGIEQLQELTNGTKE